MSRGQRCFCGEPPLYVAPPSPLTPVSLDVSFFLRRSATHIDPPPLLCHLRCTAEQARSYPRRHHSVARSELARRPHQVQNPSRGWNKVRCAFSDRNLHSRMPLVPTPLLRLKRCHACDQWHSSRVFAPLTGWHCKFYPNTEGTGSCLLPMTL
jgi:hypothetical protein